MPGFKEAGTSLPTAAMTAPTSCPGITGNFTIGLRPKNAVSYTHLWMFKSVVKVCGSTVKLQLILDILSKYSQGKIFYCFHTLFLFFGSMATSQSGKDAAVLFLLP